MPLGHAFETFVSPLSCSWEKLAKTETIGSLGASIRRSLLERCPIQQVHDSSRAPSTSSQKSTKRKIHPTSSQAQNFKKQEKHPTNTTVPSRSASSLITPRILQQVYSSEGFGICDTSNTYQVNRSPREQQHLRLVQRLLRQWMHTMPQIFHKTYLVILVLQPKLVMNALCTYAIKT